MFGAVTLTKNVDIDAYKYSGYGFGFDRKGEFSFGNGFGRNAIIFAVDMSSSVHTDNKNKDNPTQGLDGTTLTTEKIIQLNLRKIKRKFCLSLHYNGVTNLLMIQKIINLKQKILKLQEHHYV